MLLRKNEPYSWVLGQLMVVVTELQEIAGLCRCYVGTAVRRYKDLGLRLTDEFWEL